MWQKANKIIAQDATMSIAKNVAEAHHVICDTMVFRKFIYAQRLYSFI